MLDVDPGATLVGGIEVQAGEFRSRRAIGRPAPDTIPLMVDREIVRIRQRGFHREARRQIDRVSVGKDGDGLIRQIEPVDLVRGRRRHVEVLSALQRLYLQVLGALVVRALESSQVGGGVSID
jgi:hypothetical protein